MLGGVQDDVLCLPGGGGLGTLAGMRASFSETQEPGGAGAGGLAEGLLTQEWK